MASLNVFGYGMFGHDGETLAARWAYKRFVGPLGPDEVVRHTCDNRACQNRSHWIKGSQYQNILDAVERNRQHRPRGERNVKAKLAAAQAQFIRSAGFPAPELAAMYGVSTATVNSIRRGRTWCHV